MANPLIRQLGLQQLLQRDAEKPPIPQSMDDSGTLSALASHVRAAWGRNKLAKMKIDLKLLDCLRSRRGVYSPAARCRHRGSRPTRPPAPVAPRRSPGRHPPARHPPSRLHPGPLRSRRRR